jgi:hypothetical protein
MSRLSSLLALLTLLLAACQAARPPAESEARIIGQWSGQYGGAESPGHRVLRDVAAWNDHWRAVGQEAPRPLVPAREMAIVVFLGARRTGGYAVEITGVETSSEGVIVTTRESAPPPGAMVTQALTQPWALALVPASDRPVQVRAASRPAPRPAQR